MKRIYFVTSNAGKITSLQNILVSLNLEVTVEPYQLEYPEDKSLPSTKHIAEQGAKYCSEKLHEAVLVTDVGLFIHALKGFPGINTAFALKTIGNEGLLQLLEDQSDRSCTWEVSLGYADTNGDVAVFTKSLEGHVADEQKGSYGFGFDPIFIPENSEHTLAEEDPSHVRDQLSPMKDCFIEFGKWLAGSSR